MARILSGPAEPERPAYLSFSHLFFENLAQGGEAPAQISSATGEIATYEQIRQKSIRLAVALTKMGIKKGDVVAISSENRFEFTISSIAIMAVGAINATLNVLYSRNELIHAMNISKPCLIFCSPLTVYNIIDVLQDVPSLKRIISYSDDKPDPIVSYYGDLFIDNLDIANFKLAEVDVMNHPISILCSSGTTGLPKGVVLTHHNFLICFYHLRDRLITVNGPDDCILALMPWFHAYGFITHLMGLALRQKYVFMIRFEEEAFLSTIQKYKVTMAMVVPPLLVFLAKHPMVSQYDLSSLKEVLCGAAPLSKDIQEAVRKRIGLKLIKQGYGLTETTLAVLINQANNDKYSSCGSLVSGTQAKVIDLVTGEALGPYKEGELCFRGPLMMKSYMGDAASTENIFDSEGWLHTGDVGYYDNDEYFYIVDRIKELIKYKGFQVPPAEIEALLLKHPAVKDAAVVGFPDEFAGELPLAFVVKQPEIKVTEKELIEFVGKQVSHPKRLHGGVRFVEEIPKNPTGKILRRELRETFKKPSKL